MTRVWSDVLRLAECGGFDVEDHKLWLHVVTIGVTLPYIVSLLL